MKYVPVLDKGFRPMYAEFKKYSEEAAKTENKLLKICVERNDGYNYIYEYKIFANGHKDENNLMAERIVKTILWLVGGYKIYLAGDENVYEFIKAAYTDKGIRAFDKNFMERVYEKPFEVIMCDEKNFPKEKKCSLSVGGHLDGCRIGFDAGGSDRKSRNGRRGHVYNGSSLRACRKCRCRDADYRGNLRGHQRQTQCGGRGGDALCACAEA